MDIKEFAQLLNGRQYGAEITGKEEKLAEELGLVIVFGESDDLVEFRGAIYDEADCYDGGEILLDKDGILEKCKSECKYYRKAAEKATSIEAIWCGEDDYAWTYKTDIPHETFDIFEDGEKYCRGIVFDIKELQVNEDKMTNLLKKLEQFEADLIERDEVWNTEDGLPKVTKEFYDRWIDLQTERNNLLGRNLGEAKKAEEILKG